MDPGHRTSCGIRGARATAVTIMVAVAEPRGSSSSGAVQGWASSPLMAVPNRDEGLRFCGRAQLLILGAYWKLSDYIEKLCWLDMASGPHF